MGKAALVLLIVLTLPHAASSEASVVQFPQAELIKGCYYKNARYYSPNTLRFKKHSLEECQQQCVANTTWGCQYFGFWPESGACYLAGADAVYTQYLAEGGYTGPRVCPWRPTACTEVPDALYPGKDEEASKLAWPSHMVPAKLECWPKDFIGKRYKSCPTVQVVEDTASGWPGKCLGLKEVVLPYQETCESWCSKSVSCSVWQEVDQPDPLPPKCYQTYWSSGENCYTRLLKNGSAMTEWTPKRSQRIMHGEVRVLKKLYFVEMDGLKMAFDENYFIHQEDATKACKMACYSDLGCQWWLYNRATGCWVEDINYKALPVPVTTDVFHNDSKYASATVEGEYIQHLCPAAGDDAISSTQAVPTWPMTTTAAPTSTTAGQADTGTGIAAREAPSESNTLQPSLIAAGEEESADIASGTAAASRMAKGTIVVSGIVYDKLPDSAKAELGDAYAQLLAVNLGVEKTAILDMTNQAGKTSIEAWTPGTPAMRRLTSENVQGLGIKAPFKVAAMKTAGQAGVSEATKQLSTDSFLEEAKQDTYGVLKKYPGTMPDYFNTKTQAAIVEMPESAGLLPASVPPPGYSQTEAQDATMAREAVSSSGEGMSGSATAWIWALSLLIVAGCLGLLAWLYWSFSRRRKAKGSIADSGNEDSAPLFDDKGGDDRKFRSADKDLEIVSEPLVYSAAPYTSGPAVGAAPYSSMPAANGVTNEAPLMNMMQLPVTTAPAITSAAMPMITAPAVTSLTMAPMSPSVASIGQASAFTSIMPALTAAPMATSVASYASKALTCYNCGNVFAPDANFCRKCGKKRE